jgi:hypothetical protein
MLRATGAAVYAGPRLLGTSRQTSDLPAGRGGVHWWGRLSLEEDNGRISHLYEELWQLGERC